MAGNEQEQNCSCGSGRQYQKCCGLNATAEETESFPFAHTAEALVRASSPDEVALEIRGLPGGRHYIMWRALYEDPDDPRNLGRMGGEPGEYDVLFTLSRPGYSLLPEYSYAVGERLKGDSHLAMRKPALDMPDVPDAPFIVIEMPTTEGIIKLVGHPNENGLLGQFEIRKIKAKTFNGAERKAYQILAAFLSYYSTCLDIPLLVYQVDVTDVRTGSVRVSLANPYPEAPFFIVPAVQISKEWRGYASIYREALNSNSTTYQFLCFFKIIEGVRMRQKQIDRDAKKVGRAVRRSPLIVPQTTKEQIEWLNEIFPIHLDWDEMALKSIFVDESLGKEASDTNKTKSGDLYCDYLRPLRDKVAHGLLSDTGDLTLSFSVDEAFQIPTVQKWLPLTKCIVRWLLKSEFPDDFSF